MKILQFSIEKKPLKEIIINLSDEMRLKLFQTDEVLFNSLDYDDDNAFMNPILFFYLYTKGNKELNKIDVVSEIKSNNVKSNFILLPTSNIKIYKNSNPFLTTYFNIEFEETIETTIKCNQNALFIAWNYIKLNMPEFFDIIEMTTKEISLFNSKNQNSFAAIQYLGTAFINVNDQIVNEIFFLDDLSHQCGHVIFYFLTLKIQDFFIPDPNSKLSIYSKIQDNRSLYDVFHGLFTYTTTLNTLSNSYNSNIFIEDQKIEIIGRIGFYMQKFGLDLKLTDNSKIFSSEGRKYYNMFKRSWEVLQEEYYVHIKYLDYSNQQYFYNHHLFLVLNKIEKNS